MEDFVKDVKVLPKLASDCLDKRVTYDKAIRAYLMLKRSVSAAHVSEKEGESLGARKDFEVARFQYVRQLNEV